MENIPDVIITEGKNDYYSILYFLFLAKSEKLLNVLPGTSSSKLEAPIQIYLAWGRNFIVLLDSDKAGLTQQKRYKKDFGAIVGNKIFTLDEVNNLWANFTLEDLYTDKL